MNTSCARTHLFAHLFQVSSGSVSGLRWVVGVVVAIAILTAAERVVVVVFSALMFSPLVMAALLA